MTWHDASSLDLALIGAALLCVLVILAAALKSWYWRVLEIPPDLSSDWLREQDRRESTRQEPDEWPIAESAWPIRRDDNGHA